MLISLMTVQVFGALDRQGRPKNAQTNLAATVWLYAFMANH
jgi:hypothetical protein